MYLALTLLPYFLLGPGTAAGIEDVHDCHSWVRWLHAPAQVVAGDSIDVDFRIKYVDALGVKACVECGEYEELGAELQGIVFHVSPDTTTISPRYITPASQCPVQHTYGVRLNEPGMHLLIVEGRSWTLIPHPEYVSLFVYDTLTVQVTAPQKHGGIEATWTQLKELFR